MALAGAALMQGQGTEGANVQRPPLRCSDAYEVGLVMIDFKDAADDLRGEIGRALEDKERMTTEAGRPIYGEMTKKLREFVELSNAIAAELGDYDLAEGLAKKVEGVAGSLEKTSVALGDGKDPAQAYDTLQEAHGVLKRAMEFPSPGG